MLTEVPSTSITNKFTKYKKLVFSSFDPNFVIAK